MALQFERNLNLEEIDSDALFGIKYLSHQTTLQKIVFWSCTILSIVIYLVTQLVFKLPFIISFVICLILCGIGILFGANQDENLTIGQYLMLLLFKPSKYVPYRSTEDVYVMKDEAKELKLQEEKRKKEEQGASPEAQRRMLIFVIVFIVSIFLFLGVVISIKAYKENHYEHHTVSSKMQYELCS